MSRPNKKGHRDTPKSARAATPRSARARRRPRNLSLTPEAIQRGEEYSVARGTTLSAVVEQFLRGLPVATATDDSTLDPQERRRREIEALRARTTSLVVRDLLGVLADSNLENADPRELYREHLWRKYGPR